VRDTLGLTATQHFTLNVREMPAILADIILRPTTATLQAGERQTYTVEALDEDGEGIGDVSASATYTITPRAKGSWQKNVYISEVAGTWTVTATYRTTAVATATLTITPGQSRHLNLDYAKTTIIAGESQTYTTEARDTFGNRWDVTTETTYTITPEARGHWTDNVYTSEVAGTWVVTATYQGTVITMTLTVIPGATANLNLSPAQATIIAGQSQTYTLEASDAYQNSWNATANASYAISPQAGGAWSNNRYTSEVSGTWTVTAAYHTLTTSATLCVTPDAPASITLTPPQATLNMGEAQAYYVKAVDAFGNAWDATDDANYVISPQAGGTWSTNVYTSEIAGTWTVTATYLSVSDIATLNVRALADLALTKHALTPSAGSNNSIRPGETILYTLAYTNTGELAASHIILTETVPAYTTFNAAMSTPGWTCQPDINEASICTYPLEDLVGGASSHTIFAATVDASLDPTVDQIANTATVGYAPGYGPDPTPSNNITRITVPVQHYGIDLAIHKTNHRDIVRPNDMVIYTLTITNNSVITATGIQVTDTLPAYVTFIQASHGGIITHGNVRWPTFDLTGGSAPQSITSTSRFITVTVDNPIADRPPNLTNVAYVKDDGRYGPDTNPYDNSAEDVDTIQREEQPDLTLAKQVLEQQCYPGDQLHYTLTVQNVGDRVATQIIITDTLPRYVTLLSATPGGLRSETLSNRSSETLSNRSSETSSHNEIITWTSSNLGIGEQRIYTITGLVAGQVTTDNLALLNIAEANAGTTDPTPANNIAVAETWLRQRPSPPIILYLPLITRNYTPAPDLIITLVTVTDNNVEITLKNIGEKAVVNPFWVDLYVNPNPIPTGVNELWDELGEQGALWGFSRMPLEPEETVILSLNDDAYWEYKSNLPLPLPADAVIYVQVDSAHAGTNYGAVLEGHELYGLPYNNIYGPFHPSHQINTTKKEPRGTPVPPSAADLPPRD
jgi:uncharacterized repeat protein (TIGR01451 family)